MLEPAPSAFNLVLMAISLKRVDLLRVPREHDKKVAMEGGRTIHLHHVVYVFLWLCVHITASTLRSQFVLQQILLLLVSQLHNHHQALVSTMSRKRGTPRRERSGRGNLKWGLSIMPEEGYEARISIPFYILIDEW